MFTVTLVYAIGTGFQLAANYVALVQAIDLYEPPPPGQGILEMLGMDLVSDTTVAAGPNTVTRTVVLRTKQVAFNYQAEQGGPFVVGETLTFTTPAGTARLDTIIDEGETGKMVVSMLTGSQPVDGSTIAGGTSSATATVDGDVASTLYPNADAVKAATRNLFKSTLSVRVPGQVAAAEPVVV